MALNAYQTTLKNALQKKKEPSLNLNPLDYPQGAKTGATTPAAATPAAAAPVTGTANTGNLTAASKISSGIGKVKDALKNKSAAFKVNLLDTPQGATNNINVTGTNQNVYSGDPVSPATQAALGTPTPAAQKSTAPAATTPMKQYLWRNMGDPNMTTMTDEDKLKWAKAMQGWNNGDYTAFNENFQKEGNWSSYVDENGNVNGMLRYAGDGVGGYLPISNGQILNFKPGDDLSNVAFYGPNGEVYTADANGKLTQTGEWTQDYDPVIKNGYYKNDDHDYSNRIFIAKNGKAYTYADAPDDVLAEMGYVRKNGGLWYEPQTVAANNGGSWQQNNPLWKPAGNGGGDVPSGYGGNVPSGGNTPSGSVPSGGSTSGGSTGNAPFIPPLEYFQPPEAHTSSGENSNAQTPEQAMLSQWDYENAPEWGGSPYKQKQDESLDAAQAMKWEGSPYDPMVEEYLEKYGEDWQGSEYQPIRDEYARKAADLRWDYDPNTDPVYQAYRKEYTREGNRAMQEALSQASMRTGGLANSYAATAASQAGDYYAAQMSDKIPQLYQDAYQRYLNEYSRLLGLSDTYGQFDTTEYSRWYDQQGKNLDLAKIYNDLSTQEYGKFQDEYNRKMEGADAYGKQYKTAYGEYLDELDQWNKDRDFKYGIDRDNRADYESDRNFAYKISRDARADYESDRDFEENRRRWELNYEQDVDANAFDKWYKTQNLTLQEAEMAFGQWYKEQGLSMDEAAQTFDHWYKKQLLDMDKEQNAINNANQSTAYQKEIQAADDKRYKDGLSLWQSLGTLPDRYAEIVGYPAGTRWEDVFGNMDAEEAYSSGSSSPFEETEIPSGKTSAGKKTGGTGGSKGSGSGSTSSASASSTASTSSGNYDKALSSVRTYQATHTTMEVLQYIKRLINDGTITDDEGSQMLLYFGYVKGTGGGGSYAPASPNNVNMTK